MINLSTSDFPGIMAVLANRMLGTTPFTVGEWQSKEVSRLRQFDTYELADVSLQFLIPPGLDQLVKMMDPYPNLDWADEHFTERVGGVPLNPPPSHERWPWNRHNGTHQDGPAQQFSHTYPERFWPRHANLECPSPEECRGTCHVPDHYLPRRGIRFAYGDLQDVVDLLVRSPLTRQAYLPIWFPEDTGAAHRQRVPCTLGYHFMIRNGRMSCRYYMRSCDLVRHFADDVYLGARLMQWVTNQVNHEWDMAGVTENHPTVSMAKGPITTESLHMHIASLHAFAGDRYTLERIRDEHVTPKQD